MALLIQQDTDLGYLCTRSTFDSLRDGGWRVYAPSHRAVRPAVLWLVRRYKDHHCGGRFKRPSPLLRKAAQAACRKWAPLL